MFKNKLAILALVSMITAPAVADTKIKLSDYKTVAVQPVLAASDSRGLFESQLAASAADEDGIRAKIASADAQLANAQWELSQTTYYAPANGTVSGSTTRDSSGSAANSA